LRSIVTPLLHTIFVLMDTGSTFHMEALNLIVEASSWEMLKLKRGFLGKSEETVEARSETTASSQNSS